MTRTIFLDIDGPMIPIRAYFLPNQSKIVTQFDPCATGMLLHLIKLTDAKLVISSVHRLQGKQHIEELFEQNGIPIEHLHYDWHTTMDQGNTRTEEIQFWLNDHPDIHYYIAIDDEKLHDTLVSAKCSGYEGFSMANLLECKIALHAYEGAVDDIPESVQLERWQSTLDFIKS